MRLLLVLMILLFAVALVTTADAHVLLVRDAKSAIQKKANEIVSATSTDSTLRATAGKCIRRSPHAVDCRVLFTSAHASPCSRYLRARYRSGKARTITISYPFPLDCSTRPG